MIEILHDMFTTYIEPLLRFAGAYVDNKDHLLKPSNLSEDEYYTYENRKVMVVQNDIEYEKMLNKKEEFEMFNPFINPKHMIFVSNLVKNALSSIADPMPIKNMEFIYDEDLDQMVPKNYDKYNEKSEEPEFITKIGIFQNKAENGSIRIAFSYVDDSGNPVSDIVSFNGPEQIFALYGASLEAMKKFIKIVPIELQNTELAVNSIFTGLLKYERERAKYKADKKQEKEEGIDTSYTQEYLVMMDQLNKITYINDPFKGDNPLIYPWDRKEMKFENENFTDNIKYFVFPILENIDDSKMREVLDPFAVNDMSIFQDLVLI